MDIQISLTDTIKDEEVLAIYKANQWSSVEKPIQLLSALRNSHSLVTARITGKLVGIGNAISDGYLVVYYPHILVLPDYQRNGIGKNMIEAMQIKYSEFHQQMLTADGNAIEFYKSIGFVKAGETQSMWIYSGNDH